MAPIIPTRPSSGYSRPPRTSHTASPTNARLGDFGADPAAFGNYAAGKSGLLISRSSGPVRIARRDIPYMLSQFKTEFGWHHILPGQPKPEFSSETAKLPRLALNR
jgi:hypothetical protein